MAGRRAEPSGGGDPRAGAGPSGGRDRTSRAVRSSRGTLSRGLGSTPQDVVARRPDAARAEGQHHVALAYLLDEAGRGRLEVARVEGPAVAPPGDGLGQRLRGDPGDRLLAGRIDVGEDQDIGLVEAAAELVPEVLRARE